MLIYAIIATKQINLSITLKSTRIIVVCPVHYICLVIEVLVMEWLEERKDAFSLAIDQNQYLQQSSQRRCEGHLLQHWCYCMGHTK